MITRWMGAERWHVWKKPTLIEPAWGRSVRRWIWQLAGDRRHSRPTHSPHIKFAAPHFIRTFRILPSSSDLWPGSTPEVSVRLSLAIYCPLNRRPGTQYWFYYYYVLCIEMSKLKLLNRAFINSKVEHVQPTWMVVFSWKNTDLSFSSYIF